jgi:hypothetical protein
MVEGKRNADIAIILGMRDQTVKGHVAGIFRKLGVESRHAALRIGLERLRDAKKNECGPFEKSRALFFSSRSLGVI